MCCNQESHHPDWGRLGLAAPLGSPEAAADKCTSKMAGSLRIQVRLRKCEKGSEFWECRTGRWASRGRTRDQMVPHPEFHPTTALHTKESVRSSGPSCEWRRGVACAGECAEARGVYECYRTGFGSHGPAALVRVGREFSSEADRAAAKSAIKHDGMSSLQSSQLGQNFAHLTRYLPDAVTPCRNAATSRNPDLIGLIPNRFRPGKGRSKTWELIQRVDWNVRSNSGCSQEHTGVCPSTAECRTTVGGQSSPGYSRGARETLRRPRTT
jgi:hypothetical protein